MIYSKLLKNIIFYYIIYSERIVIILKIRDGFILKKVVDTYMVVPVGENLVDFAAMISLNETGAFLWECLTEEITDDQLADKMCAEYNIDKDTALADIKDFIKTLKKQNLLV